MENNYVKLSTGIINKRKPVYVRFEEQLSQLVDSYNQEKLIDYLKIFLFVENYVETFFFV
ncbi:hypothetical protein BpHYR1_030264 [Brachionus plicatilis]|uniref:Uncharacterized protein n=1 Tax=Brachionus plicatilis TaxID=10195 RepID=A0A3M7RUK1_BRAPC|nr:hypothetical protein BpHYR1_030264 [Brachionus plicatilis]